MRSGWAVKAHQLLCGSCLPRGVLGGGRRRPDPLAETSLALAGITSAALAEHRPEQLRVRRQSADRLLVDHVPAREMREQVDLSRRQVELEDRVVVRKLTVQERIG